MTTIRDQLWLWGHDAGSHDRIYGLPGRSRIPPTEAAMYLGVPNLIMVRYNDRPAPPLDQYAVPLRALKRVVWSILGAAGTNDASYRNHVIELASRCENVSGLIMDDFFSADPTTPVMTTVQLQEVREELIAAGLDLWVVLYDHQLGFPVTGHLDLCDKITFWTWKCSDLSNLEDNFAKVESLAPGKGKLLGVYMWDYGMERPMDLKSMQHQCELGRRWLRERRIEGIILLASCICDLEIEAVEWVRRWIAEVGDQKA